MRILLVQPGLSEGVGFRLVASPEPLHLEMIAATVPEHDVRILDMRLDPDLESALGTFEPDVVAVTALTPEVPQARDILGRAKAFSPDVFTVAGGHHATLLPQDFSLPQVDVVALGEGETTFPKLMQAVAARHSLADVPSVVWQNHDGVFTRNERSQEKIDLGRLPMPRRDLTQAYRDEYFFLFDRPDTSVATSRGCPFRCGFCSVHEFHRGSINQMPVERVLAEVSGISTEHITFVDDNFLMNHARETAIADRIRSAGIRKRYSMECRADSIVRHPELVAKWVDIGLYAVLLGLEGGSDEMLKDVGKSCTIETNNQAIRILQDHGVIIWGAFIVDPGWAADDFERLHDYVHDKRITHTQFTVLTPLPGTQLYRERQEELLTDDYSCFDTLHAVVPTRLPREEFYQRFAGLYRQTDIGPYYDLVQSGKMTIEDCRRGKQMLDVLADWERYIEKDPILGCTDGVTARNAGQRRSPHAVPRRSNLTRRSGQTRDIRRRWRRSSMWRQTMRDRCCRVGVTLLLISVLAAVPRMAFAQVDAVSIHVDATQRGEPLKHVWQYYGFDECNYTTTPDCVDLMKTVAEINVRPTYLREHFLLNSGDGTATLKWGSTNVYTEDQDGRPVYSWQIMDPILDAVVASGCRPLVEIGFMPKDLSSRPEPYRNSDTYKLDGGCFYPPKDYEKWAELIRQWARHSAERYKNVEDNWLWELWNEPDIAYWHGTHEEYCTLFDHTEKALHEVLPRATFGGPHTAGSGRFLRDFLTHCANGTNHVSGMQGTRLDYIGFHAKGGVSLHEGHVRMDLGNQLRLHNRGFGVVADFPKYRDTPIIIGEADPDGCAGCPSTRFPERAYRNVPAYAAYEAAMMKYSLDLAKRQKVNLRGLVTWAFLFDDQPYFEGFRSLATNGIHKPVLNAFKMLGQLTGDEVPLTSDGALGLDEMLRAGVRARPDINGMAVADARHVKILLWNYHDDLVETKPAATQLKVRLPGDFGAEVRLTHYRIDNTHSNAYTKWVQLGSPQTPSQEMLAQLRTAMQLELLEPVQAVDVKDGCVTLDFELPRFGLSLIILEKAE